MNKTPQWLNLIIFSISISFGFLVIIPMLEINWSWFDLELFDSEGERVYADLVIENSRIWTGNSYQPWAESMAIINDTIAAIGDANDIDDLINSNTQVIDGIGTMVTPGFIDSHVHFLELGMTLSSVQLRDADTKEEFIKRIADYASKLKSGEWILGGTWDHENWGGELPTRDWIDSISADNPVWIQRLDGHMGLANSVALQQAGIYGGVEEVEGGSIVRDTRDSLTGIFKDNAMVLINQAVPEPSIYDKVDILRTAMDHVAANGVTSVIHVDGEIEVFETARKMNILRTRIYAATPLSQWESLKARIDTAGYGDELLKIGALKAFVDGSLGSHTAAFFDSYDDAPEDRGLMLTPPDSLYRWISEADQAGLHMMIHAIGDSAINTLLNIYERVIAENGPRDRRLKIEHAQHISRRDIARFSDLRVIASMQPYHAIDDGRWAEKLIGPERIKTTYAFRSLMDAGALVTFGSDAPVAPPSPLLGIYAAATRQTLDGANPKGWVPRQKISVEEALYAYTGAGAYSSYSLQEKGTLEVGKLADFVVIDRDITRIKPEEIKDAKVLFTYLGGNRIYHAEID